MVANRDVDVDEDVGPDRAVATDPRTGPQMRSGPDPCTWADDCPWLDVGRRMDDRLSGPRRGLFSLHGSGNVLTRSTSTHSGPTLF